MRKAVRASVAAFALATTVSFTATAAVPKDLPYPSGDLTAEQVMDQVYFVNHFYAFNNYAITKEDRDITVLVIKGEGKTVASINLAMAFAETGRFAEAAGLQAEILALAERNGEPPAVLERLRAGLERYRRGEPYRIARPGDG